MNEIMNNYETRVAGYQFWVRDGLLRYYNKKKSPGWKLPTPLQLRDGRASSTQDSIKKIYTPEDVVKWATGEGENLSFSINPPTVTLPVIPHNAVERIVNDVRGNLVGVKVPIFVKPSESALPQEVQDRAKKDGATDHVKTEYRKRTIQVSLPPFSFNVYVIKVRLVLRYYDESMQLGNGARLPGADLSTVTSRTL